MATTANIVVARTVRVMVCCMVMVLFVRETSGNVSDTFHSRSASDLGLAKLGRLVIVDACDLGTVVHFSREKAG